MATLKSPRPTPKFFLEAQTFSTKKERNTPREEVPPRPPVKSVPPISRVFSHRPQVQRAQAISFKESDISLLNKYYNESSQQLYFDQCFEMVCKLGSGSFGDVFKVRSKVDGKYYAVKRSKERFKGKSDRQRKLEEVQKHEQLPKHRNCIRFFKAWEERQHLYLQTELCETSLSHYSEQNHEIPEHIIWNYLVDLLLAVKHLHDHDLIHLDIKPANIFISEEGICKLGDFGLVLDLKKGDFSEALEGDPKYLAPELMQGKFTKAADIFSLGITILELACDLDLPRGDSGWHQLRQGKVPSEFLECLSPELAGVICLMMEPDHIKRPTVNQILGMKAVRKVHILRELSLKKRKMVSFLLSLHHWVLLFLWYALTGVMYPFKHLSYRKHEASTPPRQENCHPSEWDRSYSDDEVFDEDDLCVSHNSMASPLSDSSSSGDMNNSNLFPGIPDRLANSTPAALRYWHTDRINPSDSPTLRWKRSSPRMSSSPRFCRQSPRTRFSATKSPLDEGNISLSIGPKNLMHIFDAEASDD